MMNRKLLAVSNMLNLYWLVLKYRKVVVSLIGENARHNRDISTAVPMVFIMRLYLLSSS
jgi:hypothetical protein